MRYVTIPFILILSLSCRLLAQYPDTLWTRVIGDQFDNYAFTINQTEDNGFIVFGYSDLGEWEQADLIKVDSLGIEQWSQSFGGESEFNRFYSGFQLSDGGYICAGFTDSEGNGYLDFWLIKTDPQGVLVWSQTYGGVEYDQCFSIQPAADGGYILAGNTNSFGDPSGDWWIVKTDSEGNEEWNQYSGIDAYDLAKDIKPTTDGGYVLAGCTTLPGENYTDICVTKTDAQGAVEWTHTNGLEDYDDFGESVIQTSDGGYAAIGYGTALIDDIYLIKLDAEGNIEWLQYLGADIYCEFGCTLCQTADNGFIVSGYFNNFNNTSKDAIIIKTDALGNILWDKTLGGTGDDYAQFICVTGNHGYIMAGSTTSYSSGVSDIWLVRFGAEITPRPFVLLTPENAEMFHTSMIDFAWTSSSSFFPEYDVTYDLSVNMNIDDILDTTTVFYSLTDTSITLSVQDLTGLQNWEQMITGIWHVEAIAGPDTTECEADFLFRVSALQGTGELINRDIPESFAINSIYPNPFNSSTTVTISIPERSDLSLSLYNITGQKVAVLVDKQVNPGNYNFIYNTNDLSSGVYFLHAFIPGKMNEIRKVVFLQ